MTSTEFSLIGENSTWLVNITEGTTVAHRHSEQSSMDFILYCIVLPILVAAGITSNMVTFCIMWRRQFRNFSIALYMKVYNICNVLFLLMLLVNLIEMVTGVVFMNYGDIICRLWQFSYRLISYGGIWIAVAMSIDRYIMLWHPLKAEDMCSVFIAKIAVVFVYTGLIVLSIHALWTFELGIDRDHPNPMCLIDYDEGDAHQQSWLWVSGICYSLLPLILIFFFCNCCLVRICLKYRDRPEGGDTGIEITNTALAITSMHFLLNLPATVINFIDRSASYDWREEFEEHINIARNVSNFLIPLNLCFVFFVWIGFCPTFRKELADCCKSCAEFRRRRRSPVELKKLTANQYEALETNHAANCSTV